jgi:hypothetical protein
LVVANGNGGCNFKLIILVLGSKAFTKNNIKRMKTKSRLNKMCDNHVAGETFNRPRVKERAFQATQTAERRKINALELDQSGSKQTKKNLASSNEERCGGKDKQG